MRDFRGPPRLPDHLGQTLGHALADDVPAPAARSSTDEIDPKLGGDLGFVKYLGVPGDGEPTLYAQSYNHVPNAAEVSFLDDVRWGGVDSGQTIGDDLLGRELRRVGVVGWMPYQHYGSMRRAAGEPTASVRTPPRMAWRDCTF